ncbi:MAG: hypothetical protein LBU88_07395 [Treponema sp.]|jgi:hypothetical protein|nr:hypothetical protein [Treponema sp.]
MRRHILLSEVEGKPAVCFDTGLEPRSFARTKMSQSLIEKGYIVNSDGTNEVWRSSGVCEHGGHMRVWGKPFNGERFDIILNKIDANKDISSKLQAVYYWLKAKMFLGDEHTTLNPAATFIGSDGSVYFSPPNLSSRCLHVEGVVLDKYNCPDLMDMDAAAFCAAAMLYQIFSGTLPYTSDETIYQDMREGIYMPIHLAAPGLNKNLCSLIQNALLLPVEKKNRNSAKKNALDIINNLIKILSDKSINLFGEVSIDDSKKQEAEKNIYLFKQNVIVKTERFAIRNKFPLMGIAGGIFFVLFIIFSTMGGSKSRPTTAGMLPDSIVFAYYNAFSNLDHVFMEACVQGSDPVIKSDINAAVTFYAVAKTRQAYTPAGTSQIIPARAWQDSGGELPAPDVFGVTELTVEPAGGDSYSLIMFRANYNLWAPNEHARRRTDTLTLQQDRRKNWRITEILRVER